MTHHVHLPATPETDRGPGRLMKGLGQRDVQYVNRTDHRTVTLFEGRFRSSVIEADSDRIACRRDIERNPVRARMVPTAEEYRWSNGRCNALGLTDPVVAAHPLDLTPGERDAERRSRYRSLFADEIPESEIAALRDATNRGFALRNGHFQRQIAPTVGRRTWPGKSGRPKKEHPDANQIELPIESRNRGLSPFSPFYARPDHHPS